MPQAVARNGRWLLVFDNATLAEVVDALESAYPGIKARVLDDEGELRRFVNVYVDNDDVRFAEIPDLVEHGHVPSRLTQHARADPTVATVLTLAADDSHPARERAENELSDRDARPLRDQRRSRLQHALAQQVGMRLHDQGTRALTALHAPVGLSVLHRSHRSMLAESTGLPTFDTPSVDR